MRLAVAAIARPTFDVPLASETSDRARRVLAERHEISGPKRLVMSTPEAPLAGDIDAIVLLQGSFADATLASALTEVASVPIVLWGFPEPRTGDRLRLNSLCGINLAGFELLRHHRDVRFLYVDPDHSGALDRLEAALSGPPEAAPRVPPVTPDTAAGASLAAKLADSRIGLIGQAPAGFTPCVALPAELSALGGPAVEYVDLEVFFRRSHQEPILDVRQEVDEHLEGVDRVDQEALDASLHLHAGLRALAADRGWDGIATRCWPECFTEFGGAACAAQGMMTERGIPSTCEADVFGTLTAIVLQEAAGGPAVVADLVDLADDGSLAFWHCGLAPVSMAGDPPAATVHPNRGLPLLHQFRLRPGRITVARLSRSKNQIRLVLGGGEVLDRPRPYSGTSAVVMMDRPGAEILETVMAEGLDHHYGIVYGDVRAEMAGMAESLGIETVWL